MGSFVISSLKHGAADVQKYFTFCITYSSVLGKDASWIIYIVYGIHGGVQDKLERLRSSPTGDSSEFQSEN